MTIDASRPCAVLPYKVLNVRLLCPLDSLQVDRLCGGDYAFNNYRSYVCISGMSEEQPKNALHGITLESVVLRLVEHYGWEELANKISINCFKSDPTVKSSLKFLRKTPWARDQVEKLYISTFELRTDTF
jgi:hypothetical protein